MADVERRPFTVAEFVRMGEVGIFSEQERVELLEGEIIRGNPVGPRHAGIVNQLHDLFQRLLGETAIVAMQTPVVLVVGCLTRQRVGGKIDGILVGFAAIRVSPQTQPAGPARCGAS